MAIELKLFSVISGMFLLVIMFKKKKKKKKKLEQPLSAVIL